MRTLLNTDSGSDLDYYLNKEVKCKIWNPKHLEIELQIPDVGRYPVAHVVIRPYGRILVGASVENLLDFVLDLTLSDFRHMDAAFPTISTLFRNTGESKWHDVVVARVIEPYSSSKHWFLLTELTDVEISSFVKENVLSDLRNANLKQEVFALTHVAEKIIDDLTQKPSNSIGRLFKNLTKTFAKELASDLLNIHVYKPKVIEHWDNINEEKETLRNYESQFLRNFDYELFE